MDVDGYIRIGMFRIGSMRLFENRVFEKQAFQVLKNIHGILKERNRKLSDIIKLTVFLTNLSNFEISFC